MDTIIAAIEEYFKNLCKEGINSNLSNMFTDVNSKVGSIAGEVSLTPRGWNSSIYDLVQNLSSTVILPIAGVILSYVLVYELISLVNERNHGADLSFFDFFKYFLKMSVAVWILSNTFTITMAVFDVAGYAVNSAAGAISSSTGINAQTAINTMSSQMEFMELSELLQLLIETWIVSFGMKILSIVITVILYGRMIEIYLYVSVSPIPFATMTNREWGSIGTNYLKGLFALGFQGFFIMICVGIYAVLINSMTVSDDVHMALFSIMGYSVVLCVSLFHTGSLSKSIFNSH